MSGRRRELSLLGGGLLAALLIGVLPADGAPERVRVSRASPFANCAIQPLPDELNYLNAEVEPWVAVNPRNGANLVGVYQQDRWQSGGARGLVTGVSHNRGETWSRTFAHFTRCAGGTASNHGNYERASDPWVTISPDGVAHEISLSFDFIDDVNQAVLVSRSTDDGDRWSEPIALIADTDPTVADDKETITADPRNSRLVYAVWDRLVFTDATQSVVVRGPTLFARTTDGGQNWEPARVIYDPGPDAQTISNQIVVLPNGDLVNLFARFFNDNEGSPNPGDAAVVVIRSTDKGVTWSAPIVVNTLGTVGITDPKTGEPVRTGDIIPSLAVDRESGALHVVWQDARFSGGDHDGIAFSTSLDGGRMWSAPRQINKAPKVQAFTAAIATTEDELAVTYYDFRHDNANPNVLLTDYWRIVSRNGGRTFRESHLAGPFDMRTAPNAAGFFLGDYEGLGRTAETFVPFFVMANSGNVNNRTDVFVSTPEGDDDNDAGQQFVGSAAGQQSNLSAPARGWRERIDAHRESRRPGR